MTRSVSTWPEVPALPAVYAMHGGERPRTWVAYVGIAGDLQGRLRQHFVRRDSSVVTGSSAVGVNIDLVNHVDWWEHPTFADDDHRHAAEMIAFEVLDPALRSRGSPRRSARDLFDDSSFHADDAAVPKAGHWTFHPATTQRPGRRGPFAARASERARGAGRTH